MITPQTDIILLKSPIELSINHQLNFSNSTQQFNYFYNLPKISGDGRATYMRKDGVLRFEGNFDELINYNYCMYKNEAYSNKWFYAFIENIEYLNDNTCAIKLKTDVWQTWQFDLNFRQSFVEREHVTDDTIGSNLVDEQLEVGEYIIQNTWDINLTGTDTMKAPFVAIGVTKTPENFPQVTEYSQLSDVGRYNGISGGITYLVVLNSPPTIKRITNLYDANSASDAIVNMFVIPFAYLNSGILSNVVVANTFKIDGTQVLCYEFKNEDNARELATVTSYAPSNIDGYTPKNKKLLTYPFCYNRVTNNGGTDVVYRWEDFNNRTANYKVVASITQGMSIKLYPYNYLKGGDGTNEYEYGITGQKLPICSWSSDFYLSWVNQQGTNLAIQTGTQVASSIIGGIVNAGSGNFAGAIQSGLGLISNVSNTMQKIREAELVPPQQKGNVNSGDVNFSSGKSGFTLYDMCIKRQFAERIDKFFSQFGYKVNTLKTPQFTSRKNWNYVKTLSCNIIADIPQNDLTEIKNLFDNGITIWHNPNNFLNYNADNSII